MQEQAIPFGAVTSEQLDIAKQEYLVGRDAFERGRYGDAVRSLERIAYDLGSGHGIHVGRHIRTAAPACIHPSQGR